MISQITSGIKVSVETFFQPAHSDYNRAHFVFAYSITIENDGDCSIQLKRRHWHIIDGYGMQREVEGEGVVGEQPVIEPGQSYQYVSGCDLHTEVGKMYGTYLMQRSTNAELFEVTIPTFMMVVPYKMN